MLKGKVALVTGASRGIGKGIALKFAEQGAYVGINYHTNKKEAQDTLKQIQSQGGNGILLQGDVSDAKSVTAMVQKLVDERKHIDILVNNAGIYLRHKFEELTAETWEQVLSINLTGSFYLCKQVVPYMRPHAKIIFVSSQLAFRGSPHGADYATTKAGMLGLMRSLALELGTKQICVNAVAPGTIDTDLLARYTTKMREERAREIPLGRLGTPEDIAHACLFLASDMANYITGETINVNGGFYIH